MEYVRSIRKKIIDEAKIFKDSWLSIDVESLEEFAWKARKRDAGLVTIDAKIITPTFSSGPFGATPVPRPGRTIFILKTVGGTEETIKYERSYLDSPYSDRQVEAYHQLITAEMFRRSLERLAPEVPVSIFGHDVTSQAYLQLLSEANNQDIRPYLQIREESR